MFLVACACFIAHHEAEDGERIRGIELRSMALIDVFRGLLLALRRHLGWIWRSWDAARTELFALDIVFGEGRLDAIWFACFCHEDLLALLAHVGLEVLAPLQSRLRCRLPRLRRSFGAKLFQT